MVSLIGLASAFPKGEWMTGPEIRSALLAALPTVLIPLAIVGGILFGIATPTESAAVASLIVFLIGWLVYREIKPLDLGQLFVRTAINSSMVIFMIAAANVFGWVVVYEELPQKLADFISTVTSDPFAFLLIVSAFSLWAC